MAATVATSGMLIFLLLLRHFTFVGKPVKCLSVMLNKLKETKSESQETVSYADSKVC